MWSALLFELFPHYNTLCRFVQYTVSSPPLLLQSCNQQGHFSFSVAVLPLFRPFRKIPRIFRQEAKNTRVPTRGYSGATHNTALPGGRRVRGFVGIEPLVHPCP
jgi:hypothetical protein